MIQFPCRCGYIFRLADEEAGSSVQCPRCSLLTDAPLLSELHAVGEDGTYKLEERAVESPDHGARLSELAHTFGTEQDEGDGGQIDLRLTPEEIAAVGAPPPTKAAPPRYDPETGELIRPIEIREPIRRAAVPGNVPFAKPAVTYSTAPPGAHETWRGSIATLCSPVNIMVMATVLVVQLFVFIALVFSIATGIMLVTVGMFVIQLLLIAHYGNVVDETGVEERDDLPRLFRDLRLYEDIWSPLVGMLSGTFLCYAPSLICLMAAFMPHDVFLTTSDVLMLLAWVLGACLVFTSAMSEGFARIEWTGHVILPLLAIVLATIACFVPAGICIALGAAPAVCAALAIILALPGTLLLPGVILTMMTSGSILNLRPDRLIKTIRLCKLRYLSPFFAWIIAMVAYGLGQAILAMGVVRFVGGLKSQSWLDHTAIGYPLLCVGLIVMHFFSFELGILYRKHHAAFPWLFQRHEPVNHPGRAAAIRSASNSRARRMISRP